MFPGKNNKADGMIILRRVVSLEHRWKWFRIITVGSVW